MQSDAHSLDGNRIAEHIGLGCVRHLVEYLRRHVSVVKVLEGRTDENRAAKFTNRFIGQTPTLYTPYLDATLGVDGYPAEDLATSQVKSSTSFCPLMKTHGPLILHNGHDHSTK